MKKVLILLAVGFTVLVGCDGTSEQQEGHLLPEINMTQEELKEKIATEEKVIYTWEVGKQNPVTSFDNITLHSVRDDQRIVVSLNDSSSADVYELKVKEGELLDLPLITVMVEGVYPDENKITFSKPPLN